MEENLVAWLGAYVAVSLSFTQGVLARSLGAATVARTLGGVGGATLAVAVLALLTGAAGSLGLWPATMLVVVAGVSVASARLLAAQPIGDPSVELRRRLLAWSLWWVAGLDALAVLAYAFKAELVLVWGLGCVAPVTLFASFAARGAQHHLNAGRLLRGWIAALAAAWSASIFALPLVSLGASGELQALLWLLAACYPLMLPFATRVIVGGGAVPLDLSARAAPSVEQGRTPWVAVVTACTLAAGVQFFDLSAHFGVCNGELVMVSARTEWRNLPVLASADGERLGPFNFRAYHFDYKGYPSPYGDAALSDPSLCFASTVPLGSWFDGDMYRSPSELVLREHSGTFFVSATRDSSQGDELIATFQRQLSPRRQFDTPENRNRILLGNAFAGGAVLAAMGFARARRRASKAHASAAFLLALSLALAAILNSLLLRAHWSSSATPRPGRELAVEHSWMI